MSNVPRIPQREEIGHLPIPSAETTHADVLICEALKGPHTSTIIFLHGRGDSGHNVAAYLLACGLARKDSGSYLTLREVLPHTRFIFPTALKRPVARTSLIKNQWFDIQSLRDTTLEDEIQIEGVKETAAYVHELIRKEVHENDSVPEDKIVVMGLSQGCASGAIATLLWQGKLGGFIGMSGWLPFVNHMEKKIRTRDVLDYERVANTKIDEGSNIEAVQDLRNILGWDKENVTQKLDLKNTLKTPIFLGHGIMDMTIHINLGERLRDAFIALKSEDLTWKTYQEGHWWCREELVDIVRWLAERGFETEETEVLQRDVDSIGRRL